MSRHSIRSFVPLARLAMLASISAVLLTACAQAYVKPPYVGDSTPKANPQADCQSQGSTNSDACKKSAPK